MPDVVPEREYFERVLDERRRAHEAQHIAHDRMHEAENTSAIVAHSDMERRLEAMNELREEVLTDRAKYLLREVYDARHKELEVRNETGEKELRKDLDDLKRRFAILVGVSLVLVPLAGVLGAAVMRIFGF